MAKKNTRVYNKETQEFGRWITQNGTHYFISDENADEETVSAQTEYRQNANWSKTTAERNRNSVRLNRREYAIIKSARAQKFAEYRRNGVPKQDYVFTDNKFVLFTNNSRDEFVISIVLDIEQERDKIAYYITFLEKGSSRK